MSATFSVPTEVVQNYPKWECQFSGVAENMTVGTIWKLDCKGETILNGPLSLQFPKEEQAYSLQILNSNDFKGAQGSFEVTGYKPGVYEPEYIVITDGNGAVRVDHLKWELKSVLPPQESGQQQQPYPPLGPIQLQIPLWYWLMWGGLAALVLIGIVLAIWWRRRQRKLKIQLEKLRSNLSPDLEWLRDLRSVVRVSHDRAEALEQLARSSRVYISRKYQFWADGLKDKNVVYKIQKRGGPHEEWARFLKEVAAAQSAHDGVDAGEIEQLVEMARELVDREEQSK